MQVLWKTNKSINYCILLYRWPVGAFRQALHSIAISNIYFQPSSNVFEYLRHIPPRSYLRRIHKFMHNDPWAIHALKFAPYVTVDQRQLAPPSVSQNYFGIDRYRPPSPTSIEPLLLLHQEVAGLQNGLSNSSHLQLTA
jgi:hypothetical protein